MRGGKGGRARVGTVDPEQIRASLVRKSGAVLGRLRREEIPVWVVGGALRDALLGRPSRDVDLLVRASRERLSSLFPEGVWVGKVIPAFVLGARRGGRGPTLQITLLTSTLEEELARRDFSVNALAMRLDAEGEAGIRDPFGGLSDLSAGLLRRPCLLRNPFPEDPVRVLRLLRLPRPWDLRSNRRRWLLRARPKTCSPVWPGSAAVMSFWPFFRGKASDDFPGPFRRTSWGWF